MSTEQIHKRLTTEQARTIFENYLSKDIRLEQALALFGVKRARFFVLLSEYRRDPSAFMLAHKGNTGNRKISKKSEDAILDELAKEKKLIDDKAIPVRSYNYSAVRDILASKDIPVSVPTIISRAKENGFFLEKRVHAVHDREVLTSMPGELAQHDSSIHRWSPFTEKKWYLITTIDDYSRLLLYADFVEKESTWAHIEALKSVFLQYGCPMKYYADQHAIFRYVKDRDKFSPFATYSKFTDDVDTQWRSVLKECGVAPIYALSPQAKGKIERPYRWIQDRIVRTAAKNGIDSIEGVREILNDLVETYNTRWMHSTTKQIPIIRFESALSEGRSLFRPLSFQSSVTIDDIFSLKIDRVVDAYRRISVYGNEMRVPNGIPRDTVTLKMIPDTVSGMVKVRFWRESEFLGETFEKSEKLPGVYF